MNDTRIIDSNPVHITELRFNGEPFSPEYIHSWMNAIVSMTGWKETADWTRTVTFKLGGEELSIAECFPHSFDVRWLAMTGSGFFDLSIGAHGYRRNDLPAQLLARLPTRPRRPAVASRGFAAYDPLPRSANWCIDDILFRVREDGLAIIYLKQAAYENI